MYVWDEQRHVWPWCENCQNLPWIPPGMADQGSRRSWDEPPERERCPRCRDLERDAQSAEPLICSSFDGEPLGGQHARFQLSAWPRRASTMSIKSD